MMKLYPILQSVVSKLEISLIQAERKDILQVLIDYIQQNLDQKEPSNLNFICTHNSRRSQFSQVWAQTAADYYNIDAACFSGGVEVTACNERAIASMLRIGFVISSEGSENPKYSIQASEKGKVVTLFSKLYNDPINPIASFAAIMTCSHADENCPFIPGTEQRIPVRYEDPKEFDDSPIEAEKYDERSLQIAAEMFYIFSQLKK